MGAGASIDLTLDQYKSVKENYEKLRTDSSIDDTKLLAILTQDLQQLLEMNNTSALPTGAASPTRDGGNSESGSADNNSDGDRGDLSTLAGMVDALELDDVDLDEDVEELDLSEKELKDLPAGIFEASSLTGLYLETNQLTKIEGEWEKLEALEELYLRKNQIDSLPSNLIEGCEALDSIYLEDNRMSEAGFPDNFGSLVHLKGLTLHRNLLTAVPSSFFSLANLEELYLDHNNITVLPDEVGQLSQLKELGLIGNKLEELPKSFGELVNLEILHAENNKLAKLPKTMGNLVKLRGLYLQDNCLPKLISSVGRCLKLVTINVENNQMKGVAKRIGQLPNLKYLLLACNELKELPFNPLETAPGLRRLTLSGNQLSPEVMKLEKMETMGEGDEGAGGE